MTTSIHVGLDRDEVISIKRDSLFLQEGFLEITRILRSYNDLRKKEFLLKARIKRNMDSINKLIYSIEEDLPKEDLSFMKKKEEKNKIINEIKTQPLQKIRVAKTKVPNKNQDLERQLQEIRDQLTRLQ